MAAAGVFILNLCAPHLCPRAQVFRTAIRAAVPSSPAAAAVPGKSPLAGFRFGHPHRRGKIEASIIGSWVVASPREAVDEAALLNFEVLHQARMTGSGFGGFRVRGLGESWGQESRISKLSDRVWDDFMLA